MNARTHLLICLITCGVAALILLLARLQPYIAPLSLIFLAIAVISCIRSSRPGLCLVLIAATTTLILSLRFPYLSWGDPWQDYESVMEVLMQGSTVTTGYRLQQPVFPVIVSSLAGYLSLSPMSAQKIVIPLIGSLSVSILYFLGREYTDRKTALTASLIYLSTLPYLHWASQGVRETLGIPFFLLSLYFSHRAVRTGRVSDIILSLTLITGLILTHHQSAFMFCVIFPVMTLTELYLFRPVTRMRVEAFFICLITGFGLSLTLLWWSRRIIFIYQSFIAAVDKLSLWNREPRITPVVIGFFVLAIFAFLPSFLPDITRPVRYLMHWSYQQRKFLQIGGFFVAIGGIVLLITSFTGHSFLAVRYPFPMVAAGILILLLILIGLPLFLTSERFALLAFAAVPALMLCLGLTRAIPGIEVLWSTQIDPLRFLGYLWPPLALVAGAGVIRVFNTERRWQAGVLAIFLVSLVTTFPSIVLLGTSFDKGDIWYDDRSLVVSHPGTEIQAIEWFGKQKTQGSLTSDRYAFSAARWLNTQGKVVKEPTGRPADSTGEDYWLLTSRMDKYANFVEWITHEAYPISREEREKLDENTIRLYDNGNTVIYQKIQDKI